MVENQEYSVVCYDCGCSGSSIFIDTLNGEIVCTVCGTVQQLTWWKNEIYEQ